MLGYYSFSTCYLDCFGHYCVRLDKIASEYSMWVHLISTQKETLWLLPWTTVALSLVLAQLALMFSKMSLMLRCKLDAFECGFEALSSARVPFSLKFYMIVIIFLVFDIEIALLLPLPLASSQAAYLWWSATASVLMFVLLLGLGFEGYNSVFKWLT